MEKWVIFAVIAALLWGIEYAVMEKVISKATPLSLFFWMHVAECFIILPAAFILWKLKPELLAIGGWAEFGWMSMLSVLGIAAGFLIISSIKSSDNATASSMIEISYPLFVAISSWVLFGEKKFNLWTVLGGVLIFAGIFIISRFKA